MTTNCALTPANAAARWQAQNQNGYEMSRYYPLCHAAPTPSPDSLPWINDPEGAVWDEKANLWRAWAIHCPTYPAGIFSASSWYEFTSPDLITWTPIGIRLDCSLPENPFGALWGGSCVIDHEGTAGFGKGAAIYLITEANTPNGQSVCRWVAPEGLGVDPKFDRVVLANPGTPFTDEGLDFRDSRVWWDDEAGYWLLAISVSYGIAFYASPDTLDWSELSVWTAPGRTPGQAGGVECPNLVKIGSQWVLFYSDQLIQPETYMAQLGEWDGKEFIAIGAPQRCEWGPDYYAQSVFQDKRTGKTYVMGWLNNWVYGIDPADTPFRGFKNYLAWTREITIDYRRQTDPELAATPIVKTNPVWNGQAFSAPVAAKPQLVGGQEQPAFRTPNTNWGLCYRLDMVVEAVDGTWPSRINLNLKGYVGRRVTQIFLWPEKKMGQFFRKLEDIMPLHSRPEGDTSWLQEYDFPAEPRHGKIKLTIIVDSASVELFVNDGEIAFSALSFQPEGANEITLAATMDGIAKVSHFVVTPFKGAPYKETDVLPLLSHPDGLTTDEFLRLA